MSLIVEVNGDLEERIREEAVRENVSADEYAIRLLERAAPVVRERRSAYGKYADVPSSADAFAARKTSEKSIEDARL